MFGSDITPKGSPNMSAERTGKRQHWLIRSPDPAALVLTERDADIITGCYEYQGLTRPQVQRLFGIPGVTRANQRLRVLWEHEYLDRTAVGIAGAGLQPLYLAGRAAVPLLVDRTEQTPNIIRAHLRDDARRRPLVHDVEMNDVRIALTLGLAKDPNIKLELWHNQRQSYHAFAPGRALRPDGFVRFVADGLTHGIYLELDRGTTTLVDRWQAKVVTYSEYRESGSYAERHGLERFRVLVLAPSPQRLVNLVAASQAVAERGFLFALTRDLLSNSNPRQPIWRGLTDDRLRALVEPVRRE
jgi:hypothetical protein